MTEWTGGVITVTKWVIDHDLAATHYVVPSTIWWKTVNSPEPITPTFSLMPSTLSGREINLPQPDEACNDKEWALEKLAIAYGFRYLYEFKPKIYHVNNHDMFVGAFAVFAPLGDVDCRIWWIKQQFRYRGGVVEDNITSRTNLVCGADWFHIDLEFGKDSKALDVAIMQADFVGPDWFTQSFKHGDLIPMVHWQHGVPLSEFNRAMRPHRVRAIVKRYTELRNSIKHRMELDGGVGLQDTRIMEFPSHCSQLPLIDPTTESMPPLHRSALYEPPMEGSALWALQPDRVHLYNRFSWEKPRYL